MPIDYEAVLMDLKEMKTDVEAGIVAIERLIAWRAQGMNLPGERSRRSQKPLIHTGYNSSDSLPVRVREFLNQNPGRAYTVPEIGEAIGAENLKNLRGTLSRLAQREKTIGKRGRGKYCAKVRRSRNWGPAENAA